MYNILDYVFDPKRMIAYSVTTDKNEIELINKAFPESNQTLNDVDGVNTSTLFNGFIVNSFGICPTYNCNLRCSYCGYDSANNDENILQIDDVKAFVKDVIKRNTIKKHILKSDEPLIVYFTGGGEPAYDWKLFKDIVVFIKQICFDNGIEVKMSVTTNGILNDDQILFISRNFTRVMVSYDGLPSIQNKNRRGPGLYRTNDIVEHTISELASLRVPLEVRTTIWKDDCHKLRDMYLHVFSLVPKESDVTWSIYPVLKEGRATNRINAQSDETYHEFLLSYFDLLDFIGNDSEITPVFCPMFSDDTISYFCGSLLGSEPFLQPDGSIVLCNDSKDHSVCIGKVKDGKIGYFDHIKNNLLLITQEKQRECSDCIAYPFCKGGCPIWHLRNEDKQEKPVECQATQEYWRHVIETTIQRNKYLNWQAEQIEVPGVTNAVYLIKKMSK